MEFTQNIKKHENLHVVFWLIKDSCWMLQLRWLGVVMIIPTLIIAAVIVYATRKTTDVYINFAVLFWICANSFWMYTEFFTTGKYKLLAAIPFVFGFMCVGIYYYKTLFGKQAGS